MCCLSWHTLCAWGRRQNLSFQGSEGLSPCIEVASDLSCRRIYCVVPLAPDGVADFAQVSSNFSELAGYLRELFRPEQNERDNTDNGDFSEVHIHESIPHKARS